MCRDLVCFLIGVVDRPFGPVCFNPLIGRFRVELNSANSELVLGKEYRRVFIICIKNNQKFQHKIQTYTDSNTKSTLCISTQLKIDNTVFAVVLKPLPST